MRLTWNELITTECRGYKSIKINIVATKSKPIKAVITKCDSCGSNIDESKQKKYPMVNENFVTQKGLYHCGCLFSPFKYKGY